MILSPHGPLWCWGIQGDDAVFFSQPSHVWRGGTYMPFPKDRALLRCAFHEYLAELDGSYQTPAIQCGHIAHMDTTGMALCEEHSGAMDGSCAWCEEMAATGLSQACPGCHATWKTIGIACECCE